MTTFLNNRQFIGKVTQRRYKTFDYTTVTDRLGTVSLSDNSHLTGLINLRFNDRTFQLAVKVVQSRGQMFKM